MPPPGVSIVLATRDRLASLRTAVAALLPQVSSGATEVIVVDDDSTDGTWDFLGTLAAQGRLVHLRTRAGSVSGSAAAARNAGIRAARAPVVACTDDDCEVPPLWAERLAARLESSGAAAVGGRVVASPDARLPARLSQAITNGIVASLNRDPADALFLTSNNIAYRASVLRDVGLFDETFRGAGGEERELHHRIRLGGRRLCYAPEIVVRHRPLLGWPDFLRQQLAYGRGARAFYGRGRGLGAARPRHFSPRQYARALARALGEVPPAQWPALLAGVLLSQAAVCWGYFSGSRR